MRTVFIVVTMLCVWLGVTVKQMHRQKAAVALVRELGGSVQYDYQRESRRWTSFGAVNPFAAPPGPRWMHELIGVDYFASVTVVNLKGTSTIDLLAIADLIDLKSLDLGGTHVSDIAALAGFTALESLDLRKTQIRDISTLATNGNLKWLVLDGTQITDLSPLASLTHLESLSISGVEVTDISPIAGLTKLVWLRMLDTPVNDVTPLVELKHLKYLYVDDTLSDEELDNLHKMLPECMIARPITEQR